jgi:hypothetical protein
MGVHSTKKLKHRKENHQQGEDVTYRMGGNNFKLYI